MSDYCYIIMEEINDQMGKEKPIYATIDKVVATEKQKELKEKRTRIVQVPLLGNKEVVYYTDDDFEPLGCHGCGDW